MTVTSKVSRRKLLTSQEEKKNEKKPTSKMENTQHRRKPGHPEMRILNYLFLEISD